MRRDEADQTLPKDRGFLLLKEREEGCLERSSPSVDNEICFCGMIGMVSSLIWASNDRDRVSVGVRILSIRLSDSERLLHDCCLLIGPEGRVFQCLNQIYIITTSTTTPAPPNIK